MALCELRETSDGDGSRWCADGHTWYSGGDDDGGGGGRYKETVNARRELGGCWEWGFKNERRRGRRA